MSAGITVTVLGCDGSHAGAGGAGSGYLVRCWDTGTTIWLDAGSGTLANLQRFCDPRTLDAVVLTHRHPDHCSDMSGFLVGAEWSWGWDREPVAVYAPSGVEQSLPGRTAGLIAHFETVDDRDQVEVGGLGLTFYRTDHGPPTVAVRIDGSGRSLGYSADTGPGWPLADMGSGLDLLVCEASFTVEHEGVSGHMSARQAGRSARQARAGRLVLTHRWPAISPAAVMAEAVTEFAGPIAAACIGKGFSL